MRITIRYLIIFACMLCSMGSHAQISSYMNKLTDMVQSLKELKVYGYDYTIRITYPNGQKDQLSGKSFVDGANKIYYNTNQAQTILLTPEWYYRAEHRDKKLTIIDLKKHYTDENKQAYRADLFNNNMLSYYLDSVIIKYGRIQKYEERGDTATIHLTFRTNTPVQKMEVSYDMKRHIPFSVKTYCFYPQTDIYGNGDSNNGTTQLIESHNYSGNIVMMENDANSFFQVINGKIHLKRYKNYKTYSLL